MSFFRHKQEIDPADNDFSKISQEIKKSPEKLSEAQRLFKDNEALRKQATGIKNVKNNKE
ncbi:hypothetical protein M5C72_06580 [Companilactobacillus allii]|uniref:Uncharacterized protein n=1 Tax=Companilactobacillus allii TaxID=1847728 RepID=A0A1P8Q4K7_9LACO|nr:hypothetical protein [Companilactobacillus allii]APX72765.1 hypothetical protein BTM29_09480 [Companilactobacillus allii]USQ67553.1 hypothetical protein M5C72_06580 [Companilactobacillus allii]